MNIAPRFANDLVEIQKRFKSKKELLRYLRMYCVSLGGISPGPLWFFF